MSDYLWCSRCEKAHTEVKWTRDGKYKHGVCPSCGSSGYKNAINWSALREATWFVPIPVKGEVYSVNPTLDI